jgi:hypothetical protein
VNDRSAPALSVVVPTASPWSHVEPTLRTVLAAAARVGGEVLIASGSPERPALPAGFERVRVLERPGADVFALRAAALAGANGEIVAVTEDHCVVPESWCAQIHDIFAADPRLDVVGGAVVNASDTALMDRANFRMTFAKFAPDALMAHAPSISNVAIRRRVVPKRPEPGWFEFVLLADPGRERAMRPDLTVRHAQSHGWLGTPIVHFHNGRVTGALVTRFGASEAAPRGRDALEGMRAHLRATRRALSAVGAPRRSLWPVRLLAMAHLGGFWVGVHRGPGSSAKRLA